MTTSHAAVAEADAKRPQAGGSSFASTTSQLPGWSTMYAHRRSVAARFGCWHALSLVRRAEDVAVDAAPERGAMLEVGAGARRLAVRLASRRPGCQYHSMDIDDTFAHDYHDLSDIARSFECVVALEVVEHLPFEQIPGWLAALAERLAPGGRLVLSTPNTYYPPAYLRDATHRTPLAFDELGGLVEHAGLRVERIVRVHNDPVHRRWLRRYAFGWLFRMLGLDFAPQIVLVAERPASRSAAGG
ncbi:MAG: methyltransferase domain-containing protein [Pirellulales bacterium]